MGSHCGILTGTVTLSKKIHSKKDLSNHWEYMKGQEKNEADQKKTITITQANNGMDQNQGNGCGKCGHVRDCFQGGANGIC